MNADFFKVWGVAFLVFVLVPAVLTVLLVLALSFISWEWSMDWIWWFTGISWRTWIVVALLLSLFCGLAPISKNDGPDFD